MVHEPIVNFIDSCVSRKQLNCLTKCLKKGVKHFKVQQVFDETLGMVVNRWWISVEGAKLLGFNLGVLNTKIRSDANQRNFDSGQWFSGCSDKKGWFY